MNNRADNEVQQIIKQLHIKLEQINQMIKDASKAAECKNCYSEVLQLAEDLNDIFSRESK